SEYHNVKEVLDELKSSVDKGKESIHDPNFTSNLPNAISASAQNGITRIAPTGAFAIDNLVRRSAPLQKTNEALLGQLCRLNAEMASKHQLASGMKVKLVQDARPSKFVLDVIIDDTVPNGAVLVEQGNHQTHDLG